MKAIDTNVLIRFLMKDDERQSAAVYRIFKRAEEEREELWVPIVVILETLWVLDSVYDIPRPEIVDTIDTLLPHSNNSYHWPATPTWIYQIC